MISKKSRQMKLTWRRLYLSSKIINNIFYTVMVFKPKNSFIGAIPPSKIA